MANIINSHNRFEVVLSKENGNFLRKKKKEGVSYKDIFNIAVNALRRKDGRAKNDH